MHFSKKNPVVCHANFQPILDCFVAKFWVKVCGFRKYKSRSFEYSRLQRKSNVRRFFLGHPVRLGHGWPKSSNLIGYILWSKATFTRDRICSDHFGIGPTMVQIHSVYTGPVQNCNATVPYGIITSGPIWYQVADPIRTGSTRSHVNTRLIRTNFVSVPNGSGPLKTLPKTHWNIVSVISICASRAL